MKLFLTVLDPFLLAAEQIKIVVGLCGLILGVVIVSSGFIYYKKKSATYITPCQGEDVKRNQYDDKWNEVEYSVNHLPLW